MNSQILQIWPDLESEESAPRTKNQQGQGLKILAPDQIISSLLVSLEKLKAGNNWEKLFYLYHSKKINQNNLQKFDQYYLKMKKSLWKLKIVGKMSYISTSR